LFCSCVCCCLMSSLFLRLSNISLSVWLVYKWLPWISN
jgi:hypothetical protein